MDQLPRLGKRELICLLSFTCNYVVFVWRGFLFLWVLGMGYVILLWHSLRLTYNYFIMGKEEINNFFGLIGDIWNFFLQKCVLSSPLCFIRLLSKSVYLIGCWRDKKGQFS